MPDEEKTGLKVSKKIEDVKSEARSTKTRDTKGHTDSKKRKKEEDKREE